MQDFNPKTSKADILRGLMRNPEQSKLIKEAMDSPIGSTSRQKAKKVFSIMSKLHASRDGMGGPGMMYDQMAYGQYPAPHNDPIEVNGSNSKGMVIFHKIPKPNINFTNDPGQASKFKPRAGSFDGSGGPGDANIFNNPNPYDAFSSNTPDNNNNTSPQSSPFPSSLGQQYGNLQQSLPPSSTSSVNSQKVNTPSTTSTPAVRPALWPIDQRITQLHSMFASNPIANSDSSIRQQLLEDGYDHQDIINAVGSGASALDNIDSGFNSFIGNLFGQKQQTPTSHPGYDQSGRPYASSSNQQTSGPSSGQQGPLVASSTSSVQNQNPIVDTTSGGNSGTSNPSPTSGAGSAAINYSTSLGGADMNMSLSAAINTYGLDTIVDKAIIPNEGKPMVPTNPGNIHFIGAPGQLHSGKYDNGKELAAYATVGEGRQAIKDIITNAASGKTGAYGTSPTLLSFANTYTGTGGNGGLTGLSATAQGSVDNSTGAGMFAFNEMMNPNDPITKGQTLTQQEQGNQKTLWDKYNIGGLQDQINQLQYEGATLPQDVTGYITARDQYLKQTDQNISNFISTAMTGSAMSNPINVQNANAHLNYLYTLRGRQNQSYIGYLTDAVNQHQADLNNITNLYSTALNSYNAELTGTNNTTEKQYTQYAQALSDMYTAVDGAPVKLQTALLNNANLIIAQAQAATDPLKLGAQAGLITQGKQIEQYWGWDGSKEITSGIDLVKTLNDFQTLEPNIQPVNVIQTYANDIEKYVGQPNDTGTSANSANAVTSSLKKTLLENAITQFGHLSIAYANDAALYNTGKQEAQNMASHLAGQISGSLTTSAPKLMEAVKTLNPTGFFSSKTPPTEAQFISNVTKATGNTGDSAIASAVYAAFKRYIGDGGTPAGAVNSLLYQTSSTTTKTIPFTPDQFAQNIGNIYAQDLVQKAFATQ